MSIVTSPRAGVTLGYVKVNGTDLPVTISDEYLRWIAALTQRVGGMKALDQDEIAMMLPGGRDAVPADPVPTADAGLLSQALIAAAEDAARRVVLSLPPVDPPPDNAGLIASLMEELNMARRPKNVRQGSINLALSTTGTYTFSPAVTGLVELRHLGVSSTSGLTSETSVGLTMSGSTVTANRGTATTAATVYFEITEYY